MFEFTQSYIQLVRYEHIRNLRHRHKYFSANKIFMSQSRGVSKFLM